MEDNRIKPVSPSLARLKYPDKRKNSSKKKKKQNQQNSSNSENGNVIDDFA